MSTETIIGVASSLVLYLGVCMLVGKPGYESGWEDKDK